MIRIHDDKVEHKYSKSRYSCNQIIYKLIERQEKIREQINSGQKSSILSHHKQKVGVCIEASQDTVDSVPYLTHQDFIKQVRELTDMCDYVVINIATNGAKSNGLHQYYNNPAALEKLVKGVTFARAQELGKLAAAEYESVLGDKQDYLTSVSRQF